MCTHEWAVHSLTQDLQINWVNALLTSCRHWPLGSNLRKILPGFLSIPLIPVHTNKQALFLSGTWQRTLPRTGTAPGTKPTRNWEERVANWWVRAAFTAVCLHGISKSINVVKKRERERRSWQEEHSRKEQEHLSQKQFTLPVTGYISFVLLLLLQELGLRWKFPTPALRDTPCLNP
jgi:hypothetical protein